jgi:hypothetical protein
VTALSARAGIAVLTLQLRTAIQEAAAWEAEEAAVDHTVAREQLRARLEPLVRERRAALDAELSEVRSQAAASLQAARREAAEILSRRAENTVPGPLDRRDKPKLPGLLSKPEGPRKRLGIEHDGHRRWLAGTEVGSGRMLFRFRRRCSRWHYFDNVFGRDRVHNRCYFNNRCYVDNRSCCNNRCYFNNRRYFNNRYYFNNRCFVDDRCLHYRRGLNHLVG